MSTDKNLKTSLRFFSCDKKAKIKRSLTNRQTGRQTERQGRTDRQGHTDGQTDMDKRTDRQADK